MRHTATTRARGANKPRSEPEPVPPPEDHAAWVRDNLAWAQRVILNKCGPRGVEFAEEALAQAVATYDARIPFRAWAVRKMHWTTCALLREVSGRGEAQLSDEMLALSLDALTTYDESKVGQAEEMLSALRLIDERALRDRWDSLGAALGGFSQKQVKKITAWCGTPRFRSAEEFVDAHMLHGGSLWRTRNDLGCPALEIARTIGKTQSMVWLMIVLERSHPTLFRFRLSSGLGSVERGRIVYRTAADVLLTRSGDRWWGPDHRRCCPPADCLTDSTLVAWLVGTLYRSGPHGALNLSSTRMTPERAEQLANVAAGLGLKTSPRVNSSRKPCLHVSESDRPAAEAWLSERVPRFVWEWA